MGKITDIKALLKAIHLSDSYTLEYNEEDILTAYEQQKEDKSSIAIKILSVLGGVLATIFFLFFIGISGIYSSPFSLAILGCIFIITAIFINKKVNKLIIDTFSISLYITGFALLIFGLSEIVNNVNLVILIVAIIAFCSLLINQNYMLAFVATLIINGSILTLITYNSFTFTQLYIAINTFVLTYFFLNEAKIISLNTKLLKLYNPVKTGLLVSLLFGLIFTNSNKYFSFLSSDTFFSIEVLWGIVILSAVILYLSVLYLTKNIITINKIEASKDKTLIYALSILIAIPTFFTPSITIAIIVILLSFLVNYKTGIILGIISFLYFISEYYYSLQITLLNKSIILFVTGIVFLLFYLFTIKKLKNTNEEL